MTKVACVVACAALEVLPASALLAEQFPVVDGAQSGKKRVSCGLWAFVTSAINHQ